MAKNDIGSSVCQSADFSVGLLALQARLTRHNESGTLCDLHPSDHAFGMHERHVLGIEMAKASMPCGEVGSGSGCVCS